MDKYHMKVSNLADRISTVSGELIQEISSVNYSSEKITHEINQHLEIKKYKVELTFNENYYEPEWIAKIINLHKGNEIVSKSNITLGELKDLAEGSFVDTTEKGSTNYYSSIINLFSKELDVIEKMIR